jgi:hypothetical protein
MLTHFGSTAVRARASDEILGLLRAMPPPPATDRPTLFLHAAGDIPSLIEGVRAAVTGIPGANLEVITSHQHQPVELPASLLTYLPRWFNHIDLKGNGELYAKVPAWLAGRLGTTG